jgi:hypothetical protein
MSEEIVEVREARNALACLFIEVDESVARDVRRKVEAAFAALRERIATQEGEMRNKYNR